MNEKPGYYAILTAKIRYDQNLKANEKLMYAEITALTTKEGYCYASNKYFSDLYHVTPQTVSTWISHLEKLGYISVQIIRKGNQIAQRRIYLQKNDDSNNQQKDTPKEDTPIKKNLNTPKEKSEEVVKKNLNNPIKENLNTPIKKNLKGNITSSNNTSINNIKEIKKKDDVAKRDPIPYSKIINYLNQKTGAHYRDNSKATQRLIKARWNEGFKPKDFKKVIDIKTYEWLNDANMCKYLRPETLFGTKFEGYLNEQRPYKGQSPHKEQTTDWEHKQAKPVDPQKLAALQKQWEQFKTKQESS